MSLDNLKSIVIKTEDFNFQFSAKNEQSMIHYYNYNSDFLIPIGQQFTDAYNNCMAKKSSLENELTKLEVILDKKEEIYSNDVDYLRLEAILDALDSYNILEQATTIYSSNPPLPYIFIKDVYSCLCPEDIPKKDYLFSSSFKNDMGDPLWPKLKEKYINSSTSDRIDSIYFTVSNDFQFCLATIEYLCMCKLPLNQCHNCGTYYIPIHRNEHYCSIKCKTTATKILKKKSANYPTRAALKRMQDRLRSKPHLCNVSPSCFAFIPESIKAQCMVAVRKNDYNSLVTIIQNEVSYQLDAATSQNEISAIVEWVDTVGRQRKQINSPGGN